MTDEKFHDLISSYFEETIDDHDLQLLNRELATSSERVKQFNDRRLMIGLVLEHGLSVEAELEEEGGEQHGRVARAGRRGQDDAGGYVGGARDGAARI